MKYPLLLAVLFSCIGMAPARQTPPSPSDTVQRATAALQTDNASICTPHATGAETPPTLHPDTAQPSARTQFIRPPYLRPGDTVGIIFGMDLQPVAVKVRDRLFQRAKEGQR